MNANDWNEKAKSLIARAVLAPSSHNTQPWAFRVLESAIELYADRTRALPVNDTDDRELTISCGCALLNLRLAAAADGWDASIQLLPDPDDVDLLARLRFTSAATPNNVDAELASMMEHRRTYRKKFDERPVSDEIVDELVEAAVLEGAWLKPLRTNESRQQVATLVSEGDSIEWDDEKWRRELAAWMHPRRRGDGLSLPALAVPVAQWVVRTFDLGGGVAAKDQQLAEGSPLLAVLGTDCDEPVCWLQAGQALERVLLVACRHGLQASYLNQPVQVYSLRSRLQDMVSGEFPQILLRLGFPTEEIAAAPRRFVEDVIEHA
jgi:nitroreductase